MDEGGGGCLGYLIAAVIVIAIIAVIVYAVIMIASVLAGIAGVGGLAWGGGTALVNYGKSFKENMIDSNRANA